MTHSTQIASFRKTSRTRKAIGIDIGDRVSHLAIVEQGGDLLGEARVNTTSKGFTEFFSKVPKGTRIVLETGTHSPWISGLLKGLGHEVIVANPYHAGRAILANGAKNDKLDAMLLASFGLSSPNLLRPIKHRSLEAHADLSVIRARGGVVEMRTKTILMIRGMVKSSGHRLPSCSAESFAGKVSDSIPENLKPALEPLLEIVEELTRKIRAYDKEIYKLCKKYPETERLREIGGVGPLIAMTYVLTLEDPTRFRRSRQVGAFVGLTSRQHESGASSPQLRITKAGDRDLRRMLVIAAQHILSSCSEDSDLKRFGQRLASRGGRRGKRQAIVAVARKLAVLMHRLWISEDDYDPLYSQRRKRRCA